MTVARIPPQSDGLPLTERDVPPLLGTQPSLFRWSRPDRPTCRSQCVRGPRPCPWVGCRYHLALDGAEGGVVDWSGAPLDETCALDLADVGGADPKSVARVMGLSRQQVAATERAAIDKLRDALGVMMPRVNRRAKRASSRICLFCGEQLPKARRSKGALYCEDGCFTRVRRTYHRDYQRERRERDDTDAV